MRTIGLDGRLRDDKAVPPIVGATGGSIYTLPIAPVIVQSANYTILPGDGPVLASGTITITLPAATNAAVNGNMYLVKNAGTGVVTVASGGGTIDGATTMLLQPGGSASFSSNGTNWSVLGRGGPPSTQTVTSNYTANKFDEIIIGAGGSAITITLPDATTNKGYRYTLKNGNNGSTKVVVTIATAAGNIDGTSTLPLGQNLQWTQVVSDGTNYQVIARGAPRSVVAKSTNYTVQQWDDIISCTGTATHTMPDATLVQGFNYTFKVIPNGITVTIATVSSQTIDGASTLVLNTQNEGATLQAASGNWYVVADVATGIL